MPYLVVIQIILEMKKGIFFFFSAVKPNFFFFINSCAFALWNVFCEYLNGEV